MRFLPFTSALLVVALSAAAVLAAGPALDHTPPPPPSYADDFLSKQDLEKDPPVFDWKLQGLITSAPYDEYSHSGGPPFPAPLGIFAPAGAETISVKKRTGFRSWKEGNVLCVETTVSIEIFIIFYDGSNFEFTQSSRAITCSDGYTSAEKFWKSTTWIPDPNPPGPGIYGWISSRTIERTSTQKKVKARFAPGAGTAKLSSASPGIDLASGALDEMEITVPPGMALDLTDHSAAAGPIVVTGMPTLIRCDTILLDPGVTISDLFMPPPIVLPGAIVDGVETRPVGLPQLRTHYEDIEHALYLTVRGGVETNGDLGFVSFTASDDLGWVSTTPVGQPVPAFGRFEVQIPYAVPPGTIPGTRAMGQIVTQTSMGTVRIDPFEIAFDPPATFRWGSGTPGCTGAHLLDANETPRVGSSTLEFTCTNAPDNPTGVILFSQAIQLAGSDPFGIGTILLVDLLDPELSWVNVNQAGPGGTVTVPVSVPSNPALADTIWGSQAFWLDLTPCGPGPFDTSTSAGLGFVVLP